MEERQAINTLFCKKNREHRILKDHRQVRQAQCAHYKDYPMGTHGQRMLTIHFNSYIVYRKRKISSK